MRTPTGCPICQSPWQPIGLFRMCRNDVCFSKYQTTLSILGANLPYGYKIYLKINNNNCSWFYHQQFNDKQFFVNGYLMQFFPDFPTLDSAKHLETLINFS